jgi:hypothetical protein
VKAARQEELGKTLPSMSVDLLAVIIDLVGDEQSF